MRKTGEYKVESSVGSERVAETLILARFRAEKASVAFHERRDAESFKQWKRTMNRLHRLVMTKWTSTDNVKPPTCLFESDGGSSKEMKSYLDDLSAEELQTVLDKTASLYEKLNLHGQMKERAGDVGMGGKDAAEKAKEKAAKEASKR